MGGSLCIYGVPGVLALCSEKLGFVSKKTAFMIPPLTTIAISITSSSISLFHPCLLISRSAKIWLVLAS